ncbi:hypothetical protein [Conchiformibius steedae]|uniref:Uncharacterized protein n=1 Tax=Conchiformibius steedae TaxID=153493 RepID=A0A3P2A226_9NEIS|nr:hypothetical protein [Conchiformibius steedae]RRD89048.1 hypothetical protein EII21_10115 [Conchiformibius steedae]
MQIRFNHTTHNHAADTLPIPFGKRDDANTPKPKPQPPIVSACWGVAWAHGKSDAGGANAHWQGTSTAAEHRHDWGDTADAVSCSFLPSAIFAQLYHTTGANWRVPFDLSSCAKLLADVFADVRHCADTGKAAGATRISCGTVETTAVLPRHGCINTQTGTAAGVKGCAQAHQHGADVVSCTRTTTSPSTQPPCEWREIVIERPDPPRRRRCPRPDSGHLPIPFLRRRMMSDAAQIPLPFACGQTSTEIPPRDSYIMQNHISASFDGKPLDLIAAEIRADMGGYCWQGNLTLPPDEFARLNLPSRAHGEAPLIDININGETWRIMAEQWGDNRVFGKKTYTVTGRSVTALLGADYAPVNQGIAPNLYARQIAAQQLEFTGVKIANWEIADWLIPAGVYALSDKTPMAIITEMATTAGGFVESHPQLPQISLKKRWPAPAWLLREIAPKVQVPDSAILSIRGQVRVSARCNGAEVWATHAQGYAALVRRDGTDSTPRTAAQTHPLYAAQNVCRAAGIAALSDTGTHKIETVKLPLMPKYGLHRAGLGELWGFAESGGTWRGVITGISISASVQNDAPTVYQTLTIDRYLGD